MMQRHASDGYGRQKNRQDRNSASAGKHVEDAWKVVPNYNESTSQ